MDNRNKLFETEYYRDNNDSGFAFFIYEMPYCGNNVSVVSPHWHNHFEIAYTEAYGTICINDKTYEMVPGDIFFINPGAIHHTFRKTEGLMVHIVFDVNMLKTSIPKDPCNDFINEIISQKVKFRETIDKSTDLYSELKFETLSLISKYMQKVVTFGKDSYNVIAHLYRIMSAVYSASHFEYLNDYSFYGIRLVRESIKYIDEHYKEKISIIELSQQVNVSETYMYRLFRKYVGTTPINYINSVRLKEAYHLLNNGCSVIETAVSVGIPSVSYFIKIFKNATGKTPRVWLEERKLNNPSK